MNDKFGTEIKEGDYIAVGMRAGNSGRLGAGIVTKSEKERVQYIGVSRWSFGKKEKQKPSWLFNQETIIVLNQPPQKLVELVSK